MIKPPTIAVDFTKFELSALLNCVLTEGDGGISFLALKTKDRLERKLKEALEVAS